MITMGLHEMKDPFDTVYIHGLVRAMDGKKMSKSLGNDDPLGLIDEYGTDALLLGLPHYDFGQDIKLSEEKIDHLVTLPIRYGT